MSPRDILLGANEAMVAAMDNFTPLDQIGQGYNQSVSPFWHQAFGRILQNPAFSSLRINQTGGGPDPNSGASPASGNSYWNYNYTGQGNPGGMGGSAGGSA